VPRIRNTGDLEQISDDVLKDLIRKIEELASRCHLAAGDQDRVESIVSSGETRRAGKEEWESDI
jgi:hypothetical protein